MEGMVVKWDGNKKRKPTSEQVVEKTTIFQDVVLFCGFW